jgi:hypothetical protein
MSAQLKWEENMINTPAAYLKNPWLERLYKIGWEEIVDPHSPLAFGPTPNPWRLWQLDPEPTPWRLWQLDPEPEPWRIAVAQLVQAAQAKDLAARLPDKLKSAMMKSATSAIDAVLDEWCGTPPPKPWPWPGPRPWVWNIVSELSLVANSLQPGSLRDGILDIASQAIQKAGTPG